ncbi:NAD(P)H-dependent oxidoreductase [Nonlabens ponticola]|uniref:NAD(P)H-dependent oxidoreductase n=1 Tax=Nonlabens ponticola TaxID=2496866 RepID=A0A3S9N077_9FLAO|nr:NAD(P)H-dependent oxidoreductase [Nonlabens ponticola]AZQ44820.1 NAD(P)H-dependent oxidoreductase [Nonlabens ponticola]
MKSIENLEWRYATKKFDPSKNITQEQLQDIASVFNLTATSYGLQPSRLTIVQNKILQEKLVPISYGQRQVLDAPAVLVISTIKVDLAYINNYFDRVVAARQTPSEILAPFRKQLEDKFEAMSEDENLAWARNQAYIALGNLMTVLADMRIDSCPMEGFIPQKVDELLELNDQGLKSVLLLPIGHRASDDMFADMAKVRLNLDDAVSYII